METIVDFAQWVLWIACAVILATWLAELVLKTYLLIKIKQYQTELQPVLDVMERAVAGQLKHLNLPRHEGRTRTCSPRGTNRGAPNALTAHVNYVGKFGRLICCCVAVLQEIQMSRPQIRICTPLHEAIASEERNKLDYRAVFDRRGPTRG